MVLKDFYPVPRLQAQQAHGAEGRNPKDPTSETIRMSKGLKERHREG